MSLIAIVLIGLFLPLFPFSIAFNFLFGKITNPLLKIGLMVLWPTIGVALFFLLDVTLTSWILSWAALTALLYAFRLITQRDIETWTGFLATSVWSLFWLTLVSLDKTAENNFTMLLIYLLAYAVPLVIILLLAKELKQRFGVAYTHIYNGLSATMPRFSGILIVTFLAAIATPVFPGFFVMLNHLTVTASMTTPFLAIVLLAIWLIWSWAGMRIIQGLVIGPADSRYQVEDLNKGLSWVFTLILVLLAFSGLFISGGLQ